MNSEIVPSNATNIESIKERIFEIRGQRVMLDRDLAELYGVETKRLNEAVKRNINRFPDDFMFVLTEEECLRLRSQFATSNVDKDSLRSQNATSKRGGNRYKPFVFTEYGIAMLSTVLRSETAIQVNINIMRAFIAIRHAVAAMQTADLRYETIVAQGRPTKRIRRRNTTRPKRHKRATRTNKFRTFCSNRGN